MSEIDLQVAVSTLAHTGIPKQAKLPEVTAEKMLWVLDSCYDGNEERMIDDVLEIAQKAKDAGKPKMSAIANWIDGKMNEQLMKIRLV